MAKAKKGLAIIQVFNLDSCPLKKPWCNLHKLWRKKLFCAKSMTTLGDLTVSWYRTWVRRPFMGGSGFRQCRIWTREPKLSEKPPALQRALQNVKVLRFFIFCHTFGQCCGCGSESGSGSTCFWATRIRIHQSEVWIWIRILLWIRIRILLSSCKNSKKNLDSYNFVTIFDFLSLKNDVNVASKSNKQKKLG